MTIRAVCLFAVVSLFTVALSGQTPAQAAPASPASTSTCAVSALPQILQEIDGKRMMQTIEKLVSFGTRHSASDTTSPTRGAGAARKWILEEMNRYVEASNGRLTAAFQSSMQKNRNQDMEMVNVVATLKGSEANRYYMTTGHYDTRNSGANDATGDAPGANDDASGVAVALELARVLSRYQFGGNLVFAALEGEEQGLLGAKGLSDYAKAQKWDLEGMINNDMVGNIEGQSGAIENRTLRIFSGNRGSGDSSSRSWARYIRDGVRRYLPEANAMLVYRLDRFGRGGDHQPFFEAGFPAVRMVEVNENYNRQHQNPRVENGIEYGDLVKFVSVEYMRLAAQMNAIALVSAACAPATPAGVRVTNNQAPGNTTVSWAADNNPQIGGYEILIRDTRAEEWEKVVPAGPGRTYTLKSLTPDNIFIGVRAVGKDGTRSPVSTPSERDAAAPAGAAAPARGAANSPAPVPPRP